VGFKFSVGVVIIPNRTYGPLTGVTEAMLSHMYCELETELEGVEVDCRAQTAKRNGFAAIETEIYSRIFGMIFL